MRYVATDETALTKATAILTAIAGNESNADVKRDAGTAANAVDHVLAHVKAQRNGKAK